jgi:hypothetical protein
VIRQYLKFLLKKGQLRGSGLIAQRLIRLGVPSVDRLVLFSVVNRMLAEGDAADAVALWHSMIEQRWVDGNEAVPYNASFSKDSLPVDFDWNFSSYTGLHSWSGRSGLETEFTGDEPEDCPVAEQAIVLPPGKYTMEYIYRTTGIAPGTGIRWQIVDTGSGTLLANSPYLSSDLNQRGALSFSIQQEFSVLRLQLVYKRVPGTSRIAGTLIVASTAVRSNP